MQTSNKQPVSNLGTMLGDEIKDDRPRMKNLISESILRQDESQIPLENGGYASEADADEVVLMNLEKLEQQTFKKKTSSIRSEGRQESQIC